MKPERSNVIRENIKTDIAAAGKVRLQRKTDCSTYYTPQQVADRWGWHVESVRRAIRQGRIGAVIISRRLLIPVEAVARIEAGGRINLH
jgi:excisionase family DNA binding protein